MDIVDYGGNEIADLNKYPWQFPENHFDFILCSHILEHLQNFNAVVTELYRISRPDGLIEVRVPFFLIRNFIASQTTEFLSGFGRLTTMKNWGTGR